MRAVTLGFALAMAVLLLPATPASATPPKPETCTLATSFGPQESQTVPVTVELDCNLAAGTGFAVSVLPFRATDSLKMQKHRGTGSDIQLLQGTLVENPDFTILAFRRDTASPREVSVELSGLALPVEADKTATLPIKGPPGQDIQAKFRDTTILGIVEMRFDAKSVRTRPDGVTGMEGVLRVDSSMLDQVTVKIDPQRKVALWLFWLVGLAVAIVAFISAYSSANSGRYLLLKGTGCFAFLLFCCVVGYLVIRSGVASDATWVDILAGILGAPFGYGVKIIVLQREQALTRRQTTHDKSARPDATTAGPRRSTGRKR